jgi:hypothetical protein
MKGKDIFTQSEIQELRSLIKERINADRSRQKSIRAKMRRIGFYGQGDFGINDLQPADFEMLLKSGRIRIAGKDQPISKKVENKTDSKHETNELSIDNYEKLEFIQFDPESNSESEIRNLPGNYIICLKPNSKLPKSNFDYKTSKFNSLEVLYTGIAGKSLRTRDYKQHFTGNNAGFSTLRKSLGSLFGLKKVPRDKDPSNGKTKFGLTDEMKLSKWMKQNLIIFHAKNSNPESNELALINKYNPPLNLSKNTNELNKEFRENLSNLRTKK